MATEVYGPSLAAAINIVNFDLVSGQLIRITNIDSEYVLDTLSLTFSTPALKRVTLRSDKGILVLDTGMTTDQNIQVVFNDAFDYGDDLTLTITQTSSTDVVNGKLLVKPGAVLPVEYSIKQRLEDILTQLTDTSADPKTVVEFLAMIYQALSSGGGGGSSGGGGTFTIKPVKLTYGTVSSVAPGASQVVAQVVANDYAFKGFNATGNGNGYFYLEVNGLTVMSGNIHQLERNLSQFVQGAYPIQNGITITLRVRNESEALCDYEGVIIGE